MTDDDRRLAEAARDVIAALRSRRETVAVAESCTGGWLGRELTAEPGASDVFWGGVMVYDDAAKRELAGVAPELLARHGAVSEAVVLALAGNVRARSGASWGVAITGIAGPGGATPGKPVGTVWTGVAGASGSTARRRQLAGDRTAVRRAAVEGALEDLAARLAAGPVDTVE